MRAVESAATRIQAGFRGYRVRKQLRLARQGKKPESSRLLNAMGGGVNERVRREHSAGEQSASNRTATAVATRVASARNEGADDASVNAAQLDQFAAKIQAGVRGFLVRRRRLAQNRAATTIQATFRAFRARKEARLRAAAKI